MHAGYIGPLMYLVKVQQQKDKKMQTEFQFYDCFLLNGIKKHMLLLKITHFQFCYL